MSHMNAPLLRVRTQQWIAWRQHVENRGRVVHHRSTLRQKTRSGSQPARRRWIRVRRQSSVSGSWYQAAGRIRDKRSVQGRRVSDMRRIIGRPARRIGVPAEWHARARHARAVRRRTIPEFPAAVRALGQRRIERRIRRPVRKTGRRCMPLRRRNRSIARAGQRNTG